MWILEYFAAWIVIYIVNSLPAFMPPTWMVLVFFATSLRLNPISTVILGATAAVCGRITLYYLAKYFRNFLPKKLENNYQGLGEILSEHKTLSVPLFLTFAFYPLPSNQLFIVAGLSEINLKLLAWCFLGGRILSYGFWVGSARALNKGLEQIFTEGFRFESIIFALVTIGFLVLLPGLIPWKKIHKRLLHHY